MNNAFALWIAAGSLLGTGVMALVTFATKRGEISVDAQTNLTSGQLTFINTLSAREARLQERIDKQDVEIERLRRRCTALEYTLRAQGLPIPSDL